MPIPLDLVSLQDCSKKDDHQEFFRNLTQLLSFVFFGIDATDTQPLKEAESRNHPESQHHHKQRGKCRLGRWSRHRCPSERVRTSLVAEAST